MILYISENALYSPIMFINLFRKRQEAIREEREKENLRLERIKKKMEQDHYESEFHTIFLLADNCRVSKI